MKSKFTIAAIFLFLVLFTGNHSVADAATINRPVNNLGLMAWYTFDGNDMVPNVRDRSGNGHHLNLVNQTPTTTILGKMGQAIDFGGATDHAAGPSFSWSGGPVTVTFWNYVESTPGSPSAAFGFTTAGSTNRFSAHVPWVDDTMYFDYGDLNSGGRISTDYSAYYGKWAHIALVSAGSGSFMRIYINGELITSTGNSSDPTGLSGGFRLGSGLENSLELGNHPGKIDDFRIYNRVLSAGEIRNLYNANTAKISSSRSPASLSNGLLGHWTFDGKDMTPNVRDISGNGNHGNLTGQVSTTTGIGLMGQALIMDGSDDVVTLPIPTSATDNVTMSLWVKWNGVNNNAAFLYNGDTGSDGYGLFLSNGSCGSGNTLDILIGGKDCSAYGGANTMLGDGWNHLVMLRENGEWKIYRDGALLSSGFSLAPNTPTGNMLIGSGVGGSIDDARIYGRALSAAEIRQLYNIGISKVNSSSVIKPGTLSSGLVGHWTFDGKDMTPNVRDVSSQGNHGNLSGQVSTTSIIGVLGQSLYFDGVNDYVRITDHSSIKPANEITIAAWIKVEDPSVQQIIVDHVSASPYYGYGCSILTSKIYCDIAYNANATEPLTNATITAGKWTHFVATFNGSRFKYYIDGTVDTDVPTSGTITYTVSQDATIGIRDIDLTNLPFKGSMDDVRIYNRALTDSEVKQLYNLAR
jgi:hypothetical protein